MVLLSQAEPGGAAPAVPSPHTVLIVEDDRMSRRALTQLLREMGHQTRAVDTLAQGVNELAAIPDCLLLDLMLPDGDGEELLRQVRAQRLPVRVAVTTGTWDTHRLAAVHELGVDAIFRKPLDLAAVARWLQEDARP